MNFLGTLTKGRRWQTQCLPPPAGVAVTCITTNRDWLADLYAWARRTHRPINSPADTTPGKAAERHQV